MLGALKAVFCVMCVFAGKLAEVAAQKPPPAIHQKSRSVSANIGKSVTLECFYDDNMVSKLFWYKQTLGEKPTLLTSFDCKNKDVRFYGQYLNNWRFISFSEKGVNRLMIIDLESSDLATYYCARNYASTVEFAEGTTVLVQGPGAGLPVWVHQWASASNQSNGSVTLQCRVETGSCAGGARVYWFRESREGEAGVLHAAGGSHQPQCVRNAGVKTHTCLYTLPVSLDPSHTGIYYCAVASCGRILFGNGTKLDFAPETDSRLYFWSGVSAFTTPLCLLLAFLVCVTWRNSPPYAGSRTISTAKSGDEVLYAASGTTKKPRCREDDTWSECVYLMVKQ